MVATATLVNGAASGTYLSPGTGAHSLVASYSGDGNFLASASQAQTTTVSAIPDFVVGSVGIDDADSGRGRRGKLRDDRWAAVGSVYRGCGLQREWIAGRSDGVLLAAAGSSRSRRR